MEQAVEFEIEDIAGHRALVRPSLMSLHTPQSAVVRGHFDCDSADELRQQVFRRRQLDASWHADGAFLPRRFYDERTLVAGERVAIIGSARHEIDADAQVSDAQLGGYRASPTRLVIEPAPDAMFLYVTDWESADAR